MFPSNGDRPRTIRKLKFAANARGKLVSMWHDEFSQISQPALGKFSEPVALATEILYACPNAAISHPTCARR
jgi:xanthine dehydrogenase YagR molybdenum-binding subunit